MLESRKKLKRDIGTLLDDQKKYQNMRLEKDEKCECDASASESV